MASVNGLPTPLVSVIMAARNAETTISQATKSVLGQTLRNLELIVCNDASTDATEKFFRNPIDSRTSVLTNRSNLGPGRSRDRAIKHASAPWIALIDSDDAWHPDRLNRLLTAAENSNADVIFDDTMLCHDTMKGIEPWRRLHGTHAFGGKGTTPREVMIEDYLVSERLLIHPVIRTDFIRKHRVRHSDRRFAEDAEFYLRLALSGARFLYVPEPLYHYRISPGSLTAQAKDPTLMRKCLEECSQWEGWPTTMQDAFQRKTSSLLRNEALYHLSRQIRRGCFIQALRLLAAQPRLLVALPSRITRQLSYQAHRTFHGGFVR